MSIQDIGCYQVLQILFKLPYLIFLKRYRVAIFCMWVAEKLFTYLPISMINIFTKDVNLIILQIIIVSHIPDVSDNAIREYVLIIWRNMEKTFTNQSPLSAHLLDFQFRRKLDQFFNLKWNTPYILLIIKQS